MEPETNKESTIDILDPLEEKEVIDLAEESEKDEESKEETGKEESEKETEEESEKESEKEESEEEESEEEESEEEELETPTDEQLELMTPVRRKEILTKYPKLFKDFPYLEKAYFRDREFTEIYPTLDDAREARDKAEALDNIESKVMEEGDLSVVLQAVKEENQDSFAKVVDNFLPALQKTDPNAYYHVLGNIIKSTVIQMVRDGKSRGDDGQPLVAAANILNQFVFGTQEFASPQNFAKEKPENKDLEKERQQIMNERFENARDDLQTRVDNALRATIDVNIDPNKKMTDYIRRNANRDAFDSLENLLSNDKSFRTVLNRLWEQAYSDKFSKNSLDRIRSAYLSRAKTLLPTVIKQARSEALKGVTVRRGSDASKRGPIAVGKSTSRVSGNQKLEVPKGMKTVDFFLRD